MKLTYRDKVLLISVLVVVVWAAGIMFFIKPAFEDMNSASTTYTDKVTEYEQKREQVESEVDLPQRVEEAYNDTSDIASKFYSTLSTDDVAETVDTLLDRDSIQNDSLTISAYSSVVLDRFGYTSTLLQTDIDRVVEGQTDTAATDAAAAAATDPEAVTAVTIPCYTVSFGFTCKFDDLKSFLDKLTTNNEKSLVVTNCTITDVNAADIEGTMTMNLMMLPKLPSPEEMLNANADSQTDTSASTESAVESEAE